jgi:hypothetical protein
MPAHGRTPDHAADSAPDLRAASPSAESAQPASRSNRASSLTQDSCLESLRQLRGAHARGWRGSLPLSARGTGSVTPAIASCHHATATRPRGRGWGGPLSSGRVTTRDTSATANPGPGLGVRVVGVCWCLAYFSVGVSGYVTQQRPTHRYSASTLVSVTVTRDPELGVETMPSGLLVLVTGDEQRLSLRAGLVAMHDVGQVVGDVRVEAVARQAL